MTSNMLSATNTVIYTRVSTSEQAEKGQSLDNQEKECAKYALRADWSVDKVFREEGASAKTAHRPQLIEMVSYCQKNKGRIKYVLFWKIDRLARSTKDYVTLKAILAKSGIQLVSATEGIDESAGGELMETVLAAIAQFDNTIRSERSSAGMRARLAEGGWVHTSPIGYKNVKDHAMRPTLEPDESAPLVKEFLLEFAKGLYTQKQAVALANGYGLKNRKGQPISANGVYKLLRNPIYAGIVSGKMLDKPVKGLHRALITEADFARIGDTLAGRTRAIQALPRGKEAWPLRGFVRCGTCKHPLTGSTSSGRNAKYSYYHCVTCKKAALRASRETVHKEFESLLEKLKPGSHTLRLFRELVLRRWNDEYKELNQQRRMLDEKIDALDRRRQTVIERNLEDRITDEVSNEQLERIGIEKLALSTERSELFEGEVEKEAVVDIAITFMANAGSLWASSTLEDRQRFQKMIYPDGIPIFRSQDLEPPSWGFVIKNYPL